MPREHLARVPDQRSQSRRSRRARDGERLAAPQQPRRGGRRRRRRPSRSCSSAAIACASRSCSCGSRRPISSGARVEDARVALDRGLAAFNEERAASTELRPISALDESWQLFDASIQLSLKEKNYERAFALAEAARARSASESKKFGADRPRRRCRPRLAPDEAILALNQFDDELAVWVITSQQRHRHDAVDVARRRHSS